jgi:hypothetical protein
VNTVEQPCQQWVESGQYANGRNGWKADIRITAAYKHSMELNLSDAIRLHRLIEIEAGGDRFIVEPHALSASDEGPSLRAFVVEGPRLGWNQFQQWSNLKVTRVNFSRREPRTS